VAYPVSLPDARATRCRSRLFRRVRRSSRAAPGLANTTKSMAGAEGPCRKASRAIRFSRFRSTARRAALREIASPRRGWFLSFRRASTVKNRSEDRSARDITRPKSVDLVRRCRGLNEKARVSRGFTRSGTQPGAAFGAAAVQYLATTTRRHTGAKPVRAVAL